MVYGYKPFYILAGLLIFAASLFWLLLHEEEQPAPAPHKTITVVPKPSSIDRQSVTGAVVMKPKQTAVSNEPACDHVSTREQALNDWYRANGFPYQNGHTKGMRDDILQLHGMPAGQLTRLAQVGSASAMTVLAQRQLNAAMPGAGFLADKIYNADETAAIPESNSDIDTDASMENGIHWARQAALNGQVYALSLLARAYQWKLLNTETGTPETDSLQPQLIAKYLAYRTLWHDALGLSTEGEQPIPELTAPPSSDVMDDAEMQMRKFMEDRRRLGYAPRLSSAPPAVSTCFE